MASALDSLLKLTGLRSAPAGRIPGTKDYNLSELVNLGSRVPDRYEIPYNVITTVANRGMGSSGVQGVNTDNSGGSNTNSTPQGTPTGSGGSGGGYTAPRSNTPDNLTEIADDSKASRIQAIKDRLGLIRDQVNREIGMAGKVRDELVSNIGQTYGGLRTSADQKVGTSLENLGQERTGVLNTYGTAKGESRRALESAMLKNRMLARAMGRLNSSFYDDRQAEATETGARNIAGLGREEAGKVAGIGTRETETKNWGEQTKLQIDQEEATLKTQANREYEQKVNDAVAMERAFGIDSEDELNQAENEYQSKLGAIQQYIENKGLRIAEIMATAGATGTGISDFSAYTPELQNLLSSNTSLTKAENSTIPTFAGAGGGAMSYLPFYNQGVEGSKLDQLLGNVLYDPRLRNGLA